MCNEGRVPRDSYSMIWTAFDICFPFFFERFTWILEDHGTAGETSRASRTKIFPYGENDLSTFLIECH